MADNTIPVPDRPILDAHVILRDGDKVLLSQRGGRYGYGQWHAPSGKVDSGESIKAAAVREMREETGIELAEDDLRLVHTVHFLENDGAGDQANRIGFFFEATTWTGDITNREPAKCLALDWHPISDLPEPLIPYPAAGIAGYLSGDNGLTHLDGGQNSPHP